MATDPNAETAAALDQTGASPRTVVGARYELVSLLGSGGMGNVYKARDVELDEIVALKVLRPEIASSPGALERFRREVKLARKVTHPNVARVFDIGEQGGDKIITMELVDGESLAALLERERLTVTRTIELANQVCAGVGAAHTAGVVHRDLKPDNVLLARDGRVVVTDFGIARAAAAAGDMSKTLGGFVGTPAYMAPEQIDGTNVDARTDIYAFGAMLFEMLTGQQPWTGETAIAIAAARLINPPPDPRSIRPDLSARMADLVLRCMARRPEDRYGTMSEITGVLATVTPTVAPIGGSRLALRERDEARSTTDKYVAVLPFRNLGPAEHEYVAEGLTDDLIDTLSMARGLRVHSRGMVMQYKSADRDARQVGRELGVQVVVEGSVRKTPGAFRISARLVSVADGLQLWAKRFDGSDAEMLALNDNVARAVADALTVDLASPEPRVADAEATDIYLRARHSYHRNYFSKDAAIAADLFAQALARAPDDARIIAGLVMARARIMTDAEARATMREQAERAVRIAPTLPEAHAALGAVLLHSFEEALAVRALRRAIRLASNVAEAHDLLGRVLEEADAPESVRHLEAAIALEPASVLPRVSLIRHYSLKGDRERTDAMLEEGLTVAPALFQPHAARTAMWRKDVARAEALRREIVPNGPPLRTGLLMLEYVLAKPGSVPPAFIAPPEAGARLHCFYAQLRAEGSGVLGDSEAALAAIAETDQHHLVDVAWLDRCPLLEFVRSDPRFLEIRDRVESRAAAIRDAYHAPDP